MNLFEYGFSGKSHCKILALPMQLWAFDSCNGLFTKKYIDEAIAGKNYFCLECLAPVRVRTSFLGLKHFFHLSQEMPCRQSSRSPAHIKVQKRLLSFFPDKDAEEEVRFDEISRVADIAYYPKKCIFEVQCSWIDKIEAEKRTASYQSIGWDVVWLISAKRFGKRYASSFEVWLQNHSHYFFDVKGDIPFFFDLPSHIDQGRRTVFQAAISPLTTPFVFVQPQEGLFRSNWKVHLKGECSTYQKSMRLALVENKSSARDSSKLNMKEFILRCLKRFFQKIFFA